MKHFNKAVWNSKNVFQKRHKRQRTHNSFTVFTLTLNVYWVWQVRVFRKNFAFTKISIIQTSIILTFEWHGNAMVFCVFIFTYWFRSNVRIHRWERHPPLLWYFFSKGLFQKLLDHSYRNVSSQQLRGALATVVWRVPYGWRFYGHGSRFVLILSSRLY